MNRGMNGFQSTIVAALTMEEAIIMARRLAAAAVCSGSGERPCGLCNHCRKVKKNIHPDVITVGLPLDDKGKPKKEIVVEQIRALISDAYIMPNEAERKVYIIENADLMNLNAQNAALKLLEEPPSGAVLILCAVNLPALLPTVRSRCALVRCGGDAVQCNEDAQKLADEYLAAAALPTASKLCRFCFANEDLDIRSASAFLDCTADSLAAMLIGRRDALGMDRTRLSELYALADRCRKYLKVNTGVKHIFGLLMVHPSDLRKEKT